MEHNYNYRRAKTNTMPRENEFEYDWTLPLSKYNTLRYEDKNRKRWQELAVGVFIRNDRFVCAEKPLEVEVSIRKTYKISLQVLCILPIDIAGSSAGKRAELSILYTFHIFCSKLLYNITY